MFALSPLSLSWSPREFGGIRWSGSVFVGVHPRRTVHIWHVHTRLLRPVNRRRRTTYRFVRPHVTQSQLVFLASPRYRTLVHPKIRFITRKTCSTFARTFALVRPVAMGFRLDEALGPWCVVLNHVTLSAVGRIAPDPCRSPMQQLR